MQYAPTATPLRENETTLPSTHLLEIRGVRDLIGPLALRSVERALSPVTQMAVHYLLHGAVRHRLHDRVAAARV